MRQHAAADPVIELFEAIAAAVADVGVAVAAAVVEGGGRDALLQKGGSSDKVQRFRDDKLNDLLTGISAAVEPQQRLQLTGDAQRYLIDNAYVIPIFEEPQVFAGAPWVKGVSFEAVGRRRGHSLPSPTRVYG